MMITELAIVQRQLIEAEQTAAALAVDQEAAQQALAELAALRAQRALLLSAAAAAWRLADAYRRGRELPPALWEDLETTLSTLSAEPRTWMGSYQAIERSLAQTATPSVTRLLAVDWRRAWIVELQRKRDAAEGRAVVAERAYQEALRLSERSRLIEQPERRVEAVVAQLKAYLVDEAPELASWLSGVAAPPLLGEVLSPVDVRVRLERYQEVARTVSAGLAGTSFHWSAAAAQHALPLLADLGLTLVSESHAQRLGYRLKRGAKPVGTRAYPSPHSRPVLVYVLECQFVKDTPPSQPQPQQEQTR